MKKVVSVLTLLVLMALTVQAQAQEGFLRTSFEVRDAAGQMVGTVTLAQNGPAVNVKGTFSNLPGGVHGIHFHAVGTCTPDFAAAGGHYNPLGKQHGLENPVGAHAGDLANLTINADGTGTYDYTTELVTLGTGQNSLFDADGTALIIHANADDYKTDPTGNSGGRIACAVVPAAQAVAAPPAAQPAPAQPAPAALPNTGTRPGNLIGLLTLAVVAMAGGTVVLRRSRAHS